MIENSLTLFANPVIGKSAWTAGALVMACLLILLLRRLIGMLKVDEDQISAYKKWITQILVIMLVFFVIRIWAYSVLVVYMPPELIAKLINTAAALLVGVFALLIVRAGLRTMKMDDDRAIQSKRWASTIVMVFLGLYLVHVWVGAELFKKELAGKFLKSAIVLAFFYMAVFFIRRFINSLKIDIRKRHQYRKRVSYTATFLYLIFLIPIWAGSTTQWATVLSVMGAGIALALHDVLLNMAGWVFIVTRRPFKDGDRIELGEVKGDVIDIQFFQTSLLEIGNWVDGDQSTGRIVHLPNGQIFRKPLFNYTKGFEYIWNELSILVTFESDWEKAKSLMLRCGEEVSREIQAEVERKIVRMSKEYWIYYKRFTPIVYTTIEESGVKLTVRYLTDAKKRRDGGDSVSRKILEEFRAADGIEFAYPTYRIYRAGEEGPKSVK